MNKMGTIIGFTFKNKVKTKAFLITTLILVVLLSIGMNIPYFIKVFKGEDTAEGGGNRSQIAVIAESGNPAAELLLSSSAPANPNDDTFAVTFTSFSSADDAALKEGLDKGDIEGYLTFGEAAGEGLPPVTYHNEDGELGGEVQTYLQSALQAVNTQLIVGDKLTDSQVAAMYAPVTIATQELSTDGTQAGEEAEQTAATINYVVVYVLLILFFMSIMMTGNMISAEVTSEKSSRIMEILITSASPLTQMFGKVIGIFLVGLMQIAIIAVSVTANLMLPHNSGILADFELDMSQLSISLLVYGLILYILGYFLYALIYAAVGSIVSRTEDLGQAITPIMMIGFVNFYVPLFSIWAPNTTLVKVASYIPFTSPLSMLLRIGVGQVAFWEIIVSLVILLVTTFAFGWLAAKIYRTGVLMYGKRPSIKEIRKAMKAYKI
ncbi:potassium ABC transporter permease [Paenibacillus sp. FSL R7-0273]|uniref:ABC transporter permease n=1 Tax=Paenibacillus sp. FSL R7-0273 TaxID=1536772 RepID=UPI0004F654D0|nr:ABC transporter permease [Paenibacillus sp. FSL R7-0273]AIQ44884.1 potassium ABC transporter permease [Paenibacillus sp. FSL R7-0273]OMF93262.1 ABC transporter permease [Paenibacillus sp. FSL R7-0273]